MKLPPAMVNWCLNATSSVKFVANAGCGVNALSGLQKHADSIYCRINVVFFSFLSFFFPRIPARLNPVPPPLPSLPSSHPPSQLIYPIIQRHTQPHHPTHHPTHHLHHHTPHNNPSLTSPSSPTHHKPPPPTAPPQSLTIHIHNNPQKNTPNHPTPPLSPPPHSHLINNTSVTNPQKHKNHTGEKRANTPKNNKKTTKHFFSKNKKTQKIYILLKKNHI